MPVRSINHRVTTYHTISICWQNCQYSMNVQIPARLLKNMTTKAPYSRRGCTDKGSFTATVRLLMTGSQFVSLSCNCAWCPSINKLLIYLKKANSTAENKELQKEQDYDQRRRIRYPFLCDTTLRHWALISRRLENTQSFHLQGLRMPNNNSY